MKQHIIIGALSVTLLCGCSSASKQAAETEEGLPVINLSENVEQVSALNLSDAVERVDIVKLETTGKSLIGEISDVQVTADDIWIKHYAGGHSNIYRFSRKGNFRNTVGKVGQGPEEYTRMNSFFVDEEAEEIYILSTVSGIKVYDYEGKYLRRQTELTMDELFFGEPATLPMIFYKGDFFLNQHLSLLRPLDNPVESLWSIALMDESFHSRVKTFKNPAHIGQEEEIEAHRAFPEVAFSPGTVVVQWREYDNDVDFSQDVLTIKFPDTDSIYQYDIEQKILLPQYAIYTDETKGNYGVVHGFSTERQALEYFSIIGYYPTTDYIYLTGYKGDTFYTYRYNIATHTVQLAKRTIEIKKRNFGGEHYYLSDRKFRLQNDITGGDFKIEYRSQGKYWVDSWQPGFAAYDEAVEKLRNSPDAPRKQELLNVIDQTGDEDNPILLIGVLK